MAVDKILIILINIALAIISTLLLLTSALWTNAPPAAAPYGVMVTVFWLLLLVRLLLTQWQSNQTVTYKSYIGPDNKVKKKLLMPGWREFAKAATGLLRFHYLLGLAVLALLFVLNHLLLFFPQYLAEQFSWFAFLTQDSRFSRENILLAACLASVLALAGAVMAQTQEIKRNNRAYNIQNLIINAHSRIALDKLHINLVDGDQMFLSTNKLEYVLQAKATPAIKQPSSSALLQVDLSLRLGGNIPVTEFYVKRLSLFSAGTVIECENFRQKFYPLFAVNHLYALNFYIHCKGAQQESLTEKLSAAGGLRLYYSLVLKNSVGIVTELYGTALYEKEQTSAKDLQYLLQEAKDNQYYYM